MRASRDPNGLLEQLAEAIDQVFWFTEVAPERVVYVSPAFEALWGRAREDLYQDPRLWVQAIHPADREHVNEAFEGWLAGRTPDYRVQYRIVRPDGSIRWIHDHAAQIRDERGALDYVSGVAKDITEERLAKDALEQALADITRLKERLQLENVYLREEIEKAGFDEIVGDSELLRRTLRQVEQVAPTDASVLLTGETGTGKELLARAIHRSSRRKNGPLVKVNCAALPGHLIESELFGHVKGAFTGAFADRPGRFEIANEGTILLDEVGELDLGFQPKLLRVLQEGEFERVGSSTTIKVNVRVVAATNRDLARAVREGTFRADLFYRLAVFPIAVPPLRMLRSDIPLLVRHFISRKNAKLGRHVEHVPQAALDALVAYDWPGNVRELENVIERAMIVSTTATLALDDWLGRATATPAKQSTAVTLDDVDRAHIVKVLAECEWCIKGRGKAADRLGLAASTLRHRMKKLGIVRPGPGSATGAAAGDQ